MVRSEPPEDLCSCHGEPIRGRAPPRLLGRSQADVFSRNRISLFLFSSFLPCSNVAVYRWRSLINLLLGGYLVSTNKSASQCRDQYYLPEPLFAFMRALCLALWQVHLHAPQRPATYHFCIARLALLRHDLRTAGSPSPLGALGEGGELLLICASAATQHMNWRGAPYQFSSCSLEFVPCAAMDRWKEAGNWCEGKKKITAKQKQTHKLNTSTLFYWLNSGY